MADKTPEGLEISDKTVLKYRGNASQLIIPEGIDRKSVV